MNLYDDITILNGVGKQRAAALNKLGIFNIYDLLTFYPRTYLDFSQTYSIAQAPLDVYVSVKATVGSKPRVHIIRKGMTTYTFEVTDGANILDLVFFNNKYIANMLPVGKEFVFYGKINQLNPFYKSMTSPKFIEYNSSGMIEPVYPQTAQINSRQILKLVKTAFTMSFRKNKFYREGAFHHLYVKAKNGNVLFYRVEDYLFIYTLVSVLSKKYNVIVELFCTMFNHLHGCVKARTQGIFRAFLRDLSSLFTVGYNEEYHLTGSLLMPCGYAPKTSEKHHKTCLIYIANNPSAGRLVKSVLEYKWGLVPYFFSDHPFSDKLVKRNARFAMRQALSIVDGCERRDQYLNYSTLKRIFREVL